MSNFAVNHLNAHNAYRARHGCPPLTLDNSLNQVAQDWANQLANRRVMQHRPGNRYGENIYMACGNPPPTVDGATPVTSWYDEIKDYNYGAAKFGSNTGHFTQVVWKGTTKMGVGIAQNG
jgi:glioma pathogenesis-related protein 2